MNATKESILACADSLGVTMTAEFIPLSKSRNAKEKHPTLNWKVTLHKGGRPFLTTDYSAGAANCPGYKQPTKAMQHAVTAWECEHGTAGRWVDSQYGVCVLPKNSVCKLTILPDFADVLYSLSADASVLDHPTYETWAGDYGFDPDSRKGEATYRACMEIALRLRSALGDDGLRRLAEAVQDY